MNIEQFILLMFIPAVVCLAFLIWLFRISFKFNKKMKAENGNIVGPALLTSLFVFVSSFLLINIYVLVWINYIIGCNEGCALFSIASPVIALIVGAINFVIQLSISIIYKSK